MNMSGSTNYAAGHDAEKRAAEYLVSQGFKIVELNWRTKYCEIDIVAKKGQAIYFVEVKYRVGQDQGAGIDYVTPKKLKQMSFAAELWTAAHNWEGLYTLSVLGMDNKNFEFIEDVL